MTGTLLETLTHPHASVDTWTLLAALPQNLASQSDVTATLTVPGAGKTTTITSLGPLSQTALRLDVPGKGGHDVTLTYTLSATLYSVRLVPGPSETPVPPLSAQDRALYTAAASPDNTADCMDVKTPSVQKFIDEHGLAPADGEDEVSFALRILTWIAQRERYECRAQDRHLSALLNDDWGDCGSFAVLFAGLMRAAGYPARLKMGIVATCDATESFCHVRSEVWIDDVGWVPIDVAAVVGSKDPRAWFGLDPGDTIYTWIDTGIRLPLSKDQEATTPFFQLPFACFWGHGDFTTGAKADMSWKVR